MVNLSITVDSCFVFFLLFSFGDTQVITNQLCASLLFQCVLYIVYIFRWQGLRFYQVVFRVHRLFKLFLEYCILIHVRVKYMPKLAHQVTLNHRRTELETFGGG